MTINGTFCLTITKAIEDLNKAIQISPQLTVAYYNRGTVYSDKGLYDKAIKDYTKVIEINPKYAEAYYDRGLAYDDKGLYDKAIELNSEYAEAYCVRGRVYRILGNCIKANADYKKACSYKCH